MATLDDIAAATGFDKSTVSVALRNLPRALRFSAETRARIHETAQRMGYRPNVFAQQLKDKKQRMLMLCVNTLRDPFAMTVAEGFEERAGEQGMRVLITALRDRQDPLDLHRDILGLHGIQGMALVGGSSSKLPDVALTQLADAGLKIVLVNRHSVHPNIGQVHAEEANGGRLVAEHIYQQKPRGVWLMGGMEGPAFTSRLNAVLAVAAEHGAPAPTILHAAVGGEWAESADLAVSERLAGGAAVPQAIICISDALAMGAGRAVTRIGLQIGRDIAITGYDDGFYARSFWPPLTTVRLPMADMGRHAASSLLSLLDPAQSPPPPNVVLPVELIIRQSSLYRPPQSDS